MVMPLKRNAGPPKEASSLRGSEDAVRSAARSGDRSYPLQSQLVQTLPEQLLLEQLSLEQLVLEQLSLEPKLLYSLTREPPPCARRTAPAGCSGSSIRRLAGRRARKLGSSHARTMSRGVNSVFVLRVLRDTLSNVAGIMASVQDRLLPPAHTLDRFVHPRGRGAARGPTAKDPCQNRPKDLESGTAPERPRLAADPDLKPGLKPPRDARSRRAPADVARDDLLLGLRGPRRDDEKIPRR